MLRVQQLQQGSPHCLWKSLPFSTSCCSQIQNCFGHLHFDAFVGLLLWQTQAGCCAVLPASQHSAAHLWCYCSEVRLSPQLRPTVVRGTQ